MSWTERTYLLLALLIAQPFVASAQWDDEEEACSAVLEGKALKLYEKGINGSKYDRAERVAFLEEAFDRDDQCMACLFEWGQLEFNSIKRSRGSFYPAQQPLLQLIDACPFFRAEAWYMLGAMAYADREYEAAQSYFEEYLRFPPASEDVLGKRRDRYVEEVKEVLPTIAFELAFRANEGKYHPASIPPVSTSRDEFLPALSPDGSLLFFTRRERYKAKGDVVSTESEVFYAAERVGGEEFKPGSALESPFNTGARYGGASISVDNRELYIAASNPTGRNPDNIDLYVTEYEILDQDDNGDFFYIWGPLSPVAALNTPDGWEAQPALSADGNELFFAAVNADSRQDRNGNPTMDIWSSMRSKLVSGCPHRCSRRLSIPTATIRLRSCTPTAKRSTSRVTADRAVEATTSGCAEGIHQVHGAKPPISALHSIPRATSRALWSAPTARKHFSLDGATAPKAWTSSAFPSPTK